MTGSIALPAQPRTVRPVNRPTNARSNQRCGSTCAAASTASTTGTPWHTNRRPFGPARVPDEILDRLAEVNAAEEALLVPVLSPEQRARVAELTQQADRLQNADPAYREELRQWTSRTATQDDGVMASSVPRTTRVRTDAVPLRDFDTGGSGGLPARTGSGTDHTLVLLATAQDDPAAWLRSGEALERLLLELTRREWVAGPITQALEVPATRQRLRELTTPAHPQMLLRISL
jgi:hypothetical protein